MAILPHITLSWSSLGVVLIAAGLVVGGCGDDGRPQEGEGSDDGSGAADDGSSGEPAESNDIESSNGGRADTASDGADGGRRDAGSATILWSRVMPDTSGTALIAEKYLLLSNDTYEHCLYRQRLSNGIGPVSRMDDQGTYEVNGSILRLAPSAGGVRQVSFVRSGERTAEISGLRFDATAPPTNTVLDLIARSINGRKSLCENEVLH